MQEGHINANGEYCANLKTYFKDDIFHKVKYHIDYGSFNKFGFSAYPLEVFFDENGEVLKVRDWSQIPPREGYDAATEFEITEEAFDELVNYWRLKNEYFKYKHKWLAKFDSEFIDLEKQYRNYNFPELAKSLKGRFDYRGEYGSPGLVFYAPERKQFIARNEIWESIKDRVFNSMNWADTRLTKEEYYDYVNDQRKESGLPLFTDADMTLEAEMERTKILYLEEG